MTGGDKLGGEGAKTRRGSKIAAFVLLLVGGVFFVVASLPGTPREEGTNPEATGRGSSSSGEPRGPSAPAPGDVAALLDGWTLGEEVLPGWRVHHFLRTNDPPVWWIELEKGEEWFSVSVGPKGTGKSALPVQTEMYEVGFGLIRPKDANIPQETLMAATEKMAERIRRREKSVGRPAGF